jgi:hypothetical protein
MFLFALLLIVLLRAAPIQPCPGYEPGTRLE